MSGSSGTSRILFFSYLEISCKNQTYPNHIQPQCVTMVTTSYTYHIQHQCVTIVITSFIFVRKKKKIEEELENILFNILLCFILYCSLPPLYTRSLASSKSLMLVIFPQELEPSSLVDCVTILLIV